MYINPHKSLLGIYWHMYGYPPKNLLDTCKEVLQNFFLKYVGICKEILQKIFWKYVGICRPIPALAQQTLQLSASHIPLFEHEHFYTCEISKNSKFVSRLFYEMGQRPSRSSCNFEVVQIKSFVLTYLIFLSTMKSWPWVGPSGRVYGYVVHILLPC